MATDWYFTITDGSTSAVFGDGASGATSYKIADNSWAPAVAGLRRSELGGRGPYEDVVEELEINVTGATRAAALANLNTLAYLLDQAERWSRGENVAAVLIKFSPKGGTVSSAANPLQAAILGRADGDETSGVSLPVTFDDLTHNAYVVRARLRFKRRGMLLANTESSAANGPGTNGSSVVSVVMPAVLNTHSPTRLDLGTVGYGKTSTERYHGGFILVGEGSVSPISIVTAEAGVAPGLLGTADANSLPLGGTVLLYAPGTATLDITSSVMGTVAMPSGVDLVSVFANVRPGDSIDYTMRGILVSDLYVTRTPWQSIEAGSIQHPRWIHLGVAPVSGTAVTVNLQMTASGTVTDLSDALYIDSVVVCAARLTQVLTLYGPADNDDQTAAGHAGSVAFNHRMLSSPSPSVFQETRPLPYAGDITLHTRAGTLYGLLLATGGGTASGGTGNMWRQSNSGGTLLTNVWRFYRRNAYLVAE